MKAKAFFVRFPPDCDAKNVLHKVIEKLGASATGRRLKGYEALLILARKAIKEDEKATE